MSNSTGSEHIMGYHVADKNDIVERVSQNVAYISQDVISKTIFVLFLPQDPGFVLPSWLQLPFHLPPQPSLGLVASSTLTAFKPLVITFPEILNSASSPKLPSAYLFDHFLANIP